MAVRGRGTGEEWREKSEERRAGRSAFSTLLSPLSALRLMPLNFNDAVDDLLVYERQEDFRGGADEYSRATLLPSNVAGKLVNCIVADNGRPGVRPGADPLGAAAVVAAVAVRRLCYFDTPTLQFLFCSINSVLYQWDGTSWAAAASYPGGLGAIVEMAQGDNLLYVSDATGQWYSYNGTSWTALGTDNTTVAGDPPVGASMMCWHAQRMFAAGSFGGFNDQLVASYFTGAGANQWSWTTFAIRVGKGEGEAITALCSLKGFFMAVGKEASIYIVNTDPNNTTLGEASTAALWNVQRLAGSVGVVGKLAMKSFGDYMLVFSQDGARIIQPSDNVDVPFEITAPVSEPMQPYIDRINWAAKAGIAIHKYRHYGLVCIPVDGSTVNNCVLVLNVRTRTWMGAWTGWTVRDLCTTRFDGEERLVFGDNLGFVHKWKDQDSSALAATYRDNGVEIPAVMRTKSWLFGEPINWKDGAFIDVRFENSAALATLAVVCDGVEQKSFVENLDQTVNQLPVDLPFDLAASGPAAITRAIDGLPEFNEMYVEVRTPGKRCFLKNVSAAAYLNTITTP